MDNLPHSSEPFELSALAVGADNDWIRILLEPYCLELAIDDIVKLEELPCPPLLDRARAVPVRVMVRCGARLRSLRGLSPSEEGLWRSEHCFPIAARDRQAPRMPQDAELEERTRSFLAEFGIHAQEAP